KPPAGLLALAVGRVQVADDVVRLVELGAGVRVDEVGRLHLPAPADELRPPGAALRHGVDAVVEVELGEDLADLPAVGTGLEVVELEEPGGITPPLRGDAREDPASEADERGGEGREDRWVGSWRGTRDRPRLRIQGGRSALRWPAAESVMARPPDPFPQRSDVHGSRRAAHPLRPSVRAPEAGAPPQLDVERSPRERRRAHVAHGAPRDARGAPPRASRPHGADAQDDPRP